MEVVVTGARGRASPSVSVVVNTLDRADWLARSLDALTRLRYPNYEIVVVAGPSGDSTSDVLRGYAGKVRVEHWPERNLAAARNKGLLSATGDILAFIDDDALPEPDWLDRLAEGFRNPAVGLVGGFVRRPDGRRWEDRIRIGNRLGGLRRRRSGPGVLGKGEYVSPTGANVAYRREALEAIGGFDPEYAYFFEETDVNLRLADAGWIGAFSPEAEVYHYRAESSTRDAKDRPRSEYRIARSKAYFVWKHGPSAHSKVELEVSLRAFVAGRMAWILSLRAQGLLSAEEARRLIRELRQGVDDGRTAAVCWAEEPAGPPPITLRSPAPAWAGRKRPRATPTRLCWVLGKDGPEWTRLHGDRLARSLADAGHDVTVIEPAAGVEQVLRTEGVWRHQVGAAPLWPGSPPRLYEKAVCREFARIDPRRRFDLAVVPQRDLGLAAALSRPGLRIYPTPSSEAEFGGLQRKILSVGRDAA